MKIVVDTNVIISGLLKPRSHPAKILNSILFGEVRTCADSRIIDEYRNVLLRDKFSFPKEDVDSLISYLESTSILVSPPPVPFKIKDPGNMPFIEVAYYLHVPVVTGNVRHFKGLQEIKIFTPTEFLIFCRGYRENLSKQERKPN